MAWGRAAAVAFATLGPPSYRPHTELSQNAEHACAFLLIGLAFGLTYPRHRLMTALIGVAMTGVLEILQFWAPGRHARWMDFVVDAIAAGVGFGAAAALEWAVRRSRLQASP